MPSTGLRRPPNLPWGASPGDRRRIILSWARQVRITVGAVDGTETLARARHQRTNYERLVHAIEHHPGYTHAQKAEAYAVVKARCNALLRPRLATAVRLSRELGDAMRTYAREHGGR